MGSRSPCLWQGLWQRVLCSLAPWKWGDAKAPGLKQEEGAEFGGQGKLPDTLPRKTQVLDPRAGQSWGARPVRGPELCSDSLGAHAACVLQSPGCNLSHTGHPKVALIQA